MDLLSQGAAGTVDMLETLPQDFRRKYESAQFLLKPEQKSLRSKMKKLHLGISKEHFSSFLEKLHAANMIVYSDEEPIAVYGFFGILKSHTAYQLIIEA